MVLSYSKADAISFLKGKFIIFIGDSNMRAIYKDFLVWIKKNKNITLKELRSKGEVSFEGDKKLTDMKLTNGKNYEEIREYKGDDIHIRFHFVTRCYSDKVENFMKSIYDKTTPAPNAIVMNSCLWDISRWGSNSVIEYEFNMTKLMILLKSTLPAECLFVWTTAPPISPIARGGFLLKNVKYDRERLPFEVIKGNSFCVKLVEESGYNTLDLHYYLSTHIDKQQKDGIHYEPDAVRYMNNLILQRLSLLFGARSIGLEIAKTVKENVLNTKNHVERRRKDLSVKESYYSQKCNEPGWKEKIRGIQMEYENWSVEMNEKLKFMIDNSENYEETGWKEKIRKIQIVQENWSRELNEKLKGVTHNSQKQKETAWVVEIALIQIKQQKWRRELNEKLKFMDDNRRKYNEAHWKEEVRLIHIENEDWSRSLYDKLASMEFKERKYDEEVWKRKVEEIRLEHENWSGELHKRLRCMIDDVKGEAEVPWKERVEKMKIEFQNCSRVLREKLRLIIDDNSKNPEKELWTEKVRQIQKDQENWSQGLNRKLRLMRERKVDRYHPYSCSNLRSRDLPLIRSPRYLSDSLFRNDFPTYESECYNYYSRRPRELNHHLDQSFRSSRGSYESPVRSTNSVNRLFSEGMADNSIQFEFTENRRQRGKYDNVPNTTKGFSAALRDKEFWIDSVESNSNGCFDQCDEEEFWSDSVENNVDGFFIRQLDKEYTTTEGFPGDFFKMVDVSSFDTRSDPSVNNERRWHESNRRECNRSMNDHPGMMSKGMGILSPINNGRRRNESRERRCGRVPMRNDRFDLPVVKNRWNESFEMEKGCLRTFGEDRKRGLFHRDRNPSVGPVRRSRNERYRYDSHQFRR